MPNRLVSKKTIKKVTDLEVAEEFKEEVNKEVERIIKKAEFRAKKNRRKTLLGRDC